MSNVKYKLLLLLVVSLPVNAKPTIQHWETDTGAKVFFVETKALPTVDIKLVFDAGSARDEKLLGLANLTATLLSEGADKLNAYQLNYEFESVGAIYSINVGRDNTSLSLRSLVEQQKLNVAVNNFRRLVSHPDFPEQALNRDLNRLLLMIKQKNQRPSQLATDQFYTTLYGTHPYGSPVIGTANSLKQITREDIINFHRHHYVTRNLTIAIVGDLSRKKSTKLAEFITADLSQGEDAEELVEPLEVYKAQNIHISHPATQTHILVGQLGKKRGEADYFPLYVGNHILGGGGMVSLLFDEIREKRGLSYSVYSYFLPLRQLGPFIASLQTQTNQADNALQILTDNIKKFTRDGPSPEALEAAKKNITGGFPLRLDSNQKLLDYITMIGFYDLPLDYLDRFNDNINAVSSEDIKDAFSRRINPNKLITVIVGRNTEKDIERE